MSAMHVATHGHGPPLVLVHGWGMHGGVFAPLLPALAARHTVHVVDLPGHGRSATSDTPLALADCAAALLARLPPAPWLGWSLGGLVALSAALAAPERVPALALIATSPRFVVAPDWPHGVEHAVFVEFARELAGDWRGTLERFLALEVHGSDRARAELRELKQHLYDHGEPAAGALAAGLEILDRTDLRAQLPKLSMPALWLAGARDRLVPAAALEAAAVAMPQARCVRITGGGHAPFIGHRERVLAALVPWLAELG